MAYVHRCIIYLSLLFFTYTANTDNKSTLAKAIEHKYCTHKHADYVIVGVGTAGSAVAKFLTDDMQTSVLALEAGQNLSQNPAIKLSRNATATALSFVINAPPFKTGKTTPQVDANNRMLIWARGVVLGGNSSLNAQIYARGTDNVYRRWQAIAGSNWSVERIQTLYKELETYHGKTTNPRARGHHGPIHILQAPRPTRVSQKFTQAIAQATGLSPVLDYNDPRTPLGPSALLQYFERGPRGVFRESGVTAFLNNNIVTPTGQGIDGRKLEILLQAKALRVIWSQRKAVGVEFLHNGTPRKAFARKGVIVCAGLNSSPFLMHSGIGPRSLLNSLNIPVVYDNPNVGQGLADHPNIVLIFKSNPADSPFPPRDPNNFLTQISWLPDPLAPKNKQVRTLELALFTPVPGITLAGLLLCAAKSRGTITIQSNDPLDPPVINLGVLSNPADLQNYKNGLSIYIKNINQQLQAIDPAYKLIFPNPSILNNDAALTRFIKNFVNSTEHFQSHCRMAPLNQGGVVDSTGHVYGVQNLLVADDSIVPLNMDGAPAASAFLIGANVAKLITQKK